MSFQNIRKVECFIYEPADPREHANKHLCFETQRFILSKEWVPGLKKLLTNLKVGFFICMQFLEILSTLGEQTTTEKLRVASGSHSPLEMCPWHLIAFVCAPASRRQPPTAWETPDGCFFPQHSQPEEGSYRTSTEQQGTTKTLGLALLLHIYMHTSIYTLHMHIYVCVCVCALTLLVNSSWWMKWQQSLNSLLVLNLPISFIAIASFWLNLPAIP